MSDAVLDDVLPDEDEGDLLLDPDNAPSDISHLEAKEAAIMADEPVHWVEIAPDRKVGIWAKSQGQMRVVDLAFGEYFDALAKYERTTQKGWRFWNRRRKKQVLAMDRVDEAKFKLVEAILEEPYIEGRDQEFTAEDYVALPHDAFVAILKCFRDANNVSDILRAMIPDFDKKKELLLQAVSAAGLRV